MEVTLSPAAKSAITGLTKIKRFSWPTLCLFIFVLLGFYLSITLYLAGMPLILLISLCSVLHYCAFTCMHEAAHGSVSQVRWINEWVGRIASSCLIAPFLGFRYMHLKHHRFTNDPKDPDLWSAKHPLIFAWFSQDFYYYFLYARERRNLPISSRIEIVVQMLLLFLVLFLLVHLGYGSLVLFAWILPARLAIGFLSFAFNFLPHYPHDPKTQTTVFTETCVRVSPLLTIPMIAQNYHNLHHLYPSAPFYRYLRIWNLGSSYFRAKGTIVKENIFEL